ncbi:FAD-binding protein [Rhodopila sp.]|uniref:FAD-binding protein n=1 Tax=Rhodopila sp. TaxID=2480087 RepID=UPI002BE14CF0|nr:FAD-binding protein [Rhodopila sp.]HVZ09990.1 FAD-binding protein [Rhodopila sp.]
MIHPAATEAEEAIAGTIRAAAAAKEPLLIEGHGTKSGMLRPVQAARTLSTEGLSGITLYAPKELVLQARAGTPLRDIETALAEGGQHLIAEPPDLSGLLGNDKPQTLGGVVASNLSGSRRIAWGAMRDHVLGIRAVTGRAEVIRSGGRVLKNVTGLDLCKLLTGSHGTLGVITEITLKVLPAPPATGTLALPGLDAEAGVRALSAALGSPFSVTGAAWVPPGRVGRVPGLDGLPGGVALVRIEEIPTSVEYRLGRLWEQLAVAGTRLLDTDPSRAVWKAVRDAAPLAPGQDDAVWRVSVRPSAGPSVLAAVAPAGVTGFLDWGGGLVWLTGPADAATHAAVEAAASAQRGTWMLLRAPDTLRGAVRVVPDEPPALARITRAVKASLDPAGILNPGRIYAGL